MTTSHASRRDDALDAAFLADFASMSTFGATAGGGVDRQAGTPEDAQTRTWLRGLLESRGFRVGYDAIGNQFALYEAVPGAPYILTGSHLDSQPLAGRFDGAYGVLASAHAAMRWVDALEQGGEAPKYNLAVVNWFNEEGSRFKPSMMGSSVFTGKLELETALETTDVTGVSVREALEAVSTIGDFEMPEVAGYAEIHVEQGRSLEDRELAIGLVDSTWGAVKYDIVVRGDQSHTGAMSYADRHDALLGAARLVVLGREVAEEVSTEETPVIASCGEFTVLPNSPVVIPREVRMLMDFRSYDFELLQKADALLRERWTAIEQEVAVGIEQRESHSWGANPYPEAGVELARQCADDLGLSNDRAQTVAGHDSTNMKDLVPTVMLFIPSVEGISHNERELTKDEDLVEGVRHLAEVLDRMTRGALDGEREA